jgi:hypothetical protein
MSLNSAQAQQQPPATPEGALLGAMRLRLIDIHYALAEATSSDLEARTWALQELMTLIRELAPYRTARNDDTDTE